MAALRNAARKVVGSMEIVPAARTARFEQLEAGDLFIYMDGRQTFYALKTQQPATGDRSTMVLLGPSFIQDVAESFLVPWQPVTVLSFGKSFSILPSLDPAAWSPTGPSRKTGAIVEGRLPGSAAFTHSWEIAVLAANHSPRSVLKYPLS